MQNGGVEMGSVSTPNPGVASLLQTLSNLNSPILASSKVTSALAKAPVSDVVEISMAASQLENVDALFGISNGSSTGASSLANLANLAAVSAGPASTTAAADNSSSSAPTSVLSNQQLASASPADQMANYQAALQASTVQGLFGTGTTNGSSGSIFNVIG
jgi:hypothetical protein